MKHLLSCAAGTALILALVACAANDGGSGSSTSAGISQSAGEQACRNALVKFHNVNDVTVVSSEPYQGGGRFVRGSVRVSADGKRELWQCIAYSDGSTGELQYLSEDNKSVAVQQPAPGTPNAAEQACLRAVTKETSNPDVALLGSEFSQAGTLVRVGVGPDRAPWQCIAYSDGSTAGVQYLGGNG